MGSTLATAPSRPQIPSLTEGGALWFTDLTAADPYFLLPALAGLSFLATIELGAADGMEGQVRRGGARGPGPGARCAVLVGCKACTAPEATVCSVCTVGLDALSRPPGTRCLAAARGNEEEDEDGDACCRAGRACAVHHPPRLGLHVLDG